MSTPELNIEGEGVVERVSSADRAFVRHLIREMRRAIEANPDSPTITTGPLDPYILERVLAAALSPSGGRE